MMERAEKFVPKQEVMSLTHDQLHRLTYKQIVRRTIQLMSVLEKAGVQAGERVGTFAWNTHRHLEIYFAAPGMGAVLHTINIRLSPEHIIYIINHAEDKVIFVDEDILPLVDKIQDHIPNVHTFIVMTDKE